MQVYERMLPRRLRVIRGDLAFLQVLRFVHLPSDQFLPRLGSGSTQLSEDSRTLELDAAGYNIFQPLDQATTKVAASINGIAGS